MAQLTIIRGLPGSGKTTLAKTHNGVVIEADMFFMQADGSWKFEPRDRVKAHVWCQRTAQCLLFNGTNVVVSNTFSQYWEMRPYMDMARDCGASILLLETTGDYGSIHNVPDLVIQRMKDRWHSQDDIFAAVQRDYSEMFARSQITVGQAAATQP